MIKAELNRRYEEGEHPRVQDYLAEFPILRQATDRVVSLLYEEYCLREERGEPLEPEDFCEENPSWRESLYSQLRYHQLLSRVIVSSPRPRFPEPGESFKHFRIQSELGRGGAARVYLALDQDLAGRPVVLKVTTDAGREHVIQGNLDHRRIVPVLSVTHDAERGLRGLCMPYRGGVSLDRLIHRETDANSSEPASVWDAMIKTTQLPAPEKVTDPGWAAFPYEGNPIRQAAWVVAQVAEALGHAHAQGVLHRDVKPANVLLSLREGPQLLDFNLAHDPNSAEQAAAAMRGGTLPYMAPEQLQAFLDPERWGEVGVGADLYSLGLVLQEMLTGERPAAPDPKLPLPRAINDLLEQRRQPASQALEGRIHVPKPLRQILDRCLAFDPRDRYASACDLVEDLQCFISGEPLRHAAPQSIQEQTGYWLRTHRPHLFMSATLVLLGGFLWTGWTLGRPHAGVQPVVPNAAPVISRASIVEDRLESARRFLSNNMVTQARDEFRAVLQLELENPQALEQLARLEHQLGCLAFDRGNSDPTREDWAAYHQAVLMFRNSVDYAERLIAYTKTSGLPIGIREIDSMLIRALSSCYLSMSYHRLNQPEPMQQWLKTATEAIQELQAMELELTDRPQLQFTLLNAESLCAIAQAERLALEGDHTASIKQYEAARERTEDALAALQRIPFGRTADRDARVETLQNRIQELRSRIGKEQEIARVRNQTQQ
jgi:serine/threonine protein kinase